MEKIRERWIILVWHLLSDGKIDIWPVSHKNSEGKMVLSEFLSKEEAHDWMKNSMPNNDNSWGIKIMKINIEV